VELDPQHGVLRVEAHDCVGAPAAGVSLDPSASIAEAQIAYFAGDGSVLEPGATATDETGVAIAFGVAQRSFGVQEAIARKAVGGALGFAGAGAVTSVVALP
jgi:hypothetical protein